jgi:hypothetical protein
MRLFNLLAKQSDYPPVLVFRKHGMFGNSLQRLAFTAFFVGVAFLSASPVLAAEDFEDLVKQIPSESCYNICQCDFTGINRPGDPGYKEIQSIKTCDAYNFDQVDYKKYKHTASGALITEAGGPPTAILGNLEVAKDTCKFTLKDTAVGVNCRLREVVKVDACHMVMKNAFLAAFDYIVERDGSVLLTKDSLPGRQANARAVSNIASILNEKNRCPTYDDPGFEQFEAGLVGVDFSATALFKEGACCCQKTDEGALTSVYTCNEGGRYPGYDCKGNIMTDSSQSFVKPLPTAPATCSSYDTVNQKEYKAGDSNFDIGTQKLRTEAKKLNKLGITNINQIIGRIIQGLMMFIGAILLVMYIYAGLLWMFSNGNEERITSAKSILVWSTLGVAVMLGSYVIINFIFSSLNL